MPNYIPNQDNQTDATGAAAGKNPAGSTAPVDERNRSASFGTERLRTEVGHAAMTDEISLPRLLRAKVPLTLAEQLTGIPYHTMYSANEAQRMGLLRTPCDENERIEVLLIDLVDYMITEAPKDRRWHPVLLPVDRIVPKPGMQPRVRPNDTAMIQEITNALQRGKTVEPIWVFQSGEHYYPVDGHRRLASHIKAGRDEISSIVIELPESYAKPLAIAANSRHAKNLSVADVRAIVIEQLQENPEDLRKLISREINAAHYAEVELGVSPATLCRALKSFRKKGGDSPSVQDVIQATIRYLERLGEHPQSEPEWQLTASLIIHRALQSSFDGISPDTLRKQKQTIRNRGSEVGRLAPSLLLSLFDRRGGDRRAQS